MLEYPELEIGLHRRIEGEYTVEFRFNQPGSAVDVRSGQVQPVLVKLDLAKLRAQTLNPESYAQTVSASFFAEEQVKRLFDRARSSAETLNLPLRVRLFIGSSAPELHAVYWESLLDLVHNQTTFFESER